ncbi:MAG: DUF6702 family protein [Bacteroidota bacterium]
MNYFRIGLLVLLLPLVVSFGLHKFYVSITKIEYVAEEGSLQIINKLFIDDIEDVLQARYSEDVTLDPEKVSATDTDLLKTYVLQKLEVSVNGEPMELTYLGHEFENDEVKSYIEVTGVPEMESISVENKMLLELFEDQQNIIHVKRSKKRRSMILDADNPKGLLNFN